MWKLSRDIALEERDKFNDLVDCQDHLGLLSLRTRLGIDLIPIPVKRTTTACGTIEGCCWLRCFLKYHL